MGVSTLTGHKQSDTIYSYSFCKDMNVNGSENFYQSCAVLDLQLLKLQL